MASTSWAEETDENINYAKLCRLLYDGGTLALKIVFDRLVPPATLQSTLAANTYLLQPLRTQRLPTGKVRRGVLSQGQWDQLYPPSGVSPISDNFDITLLFFLLRNICGLSNPATGWDVLPPPGDTSLEANLVRIKFYRNDVAAHCSKAEVGKTVIESYWSDISRALVALGLQQVDIDKLKSSPLGEKNYEQLVESWYLSDEDIKQKLEVIKTVMAEMNSKLCTIESKMQKNKSDELAYINYMPNLVKNSCKKYHTSTRKWVFDEIEENVKKTTHRARVGLIRAGPGMGKSIVASKICEIYQNEGLLGGCHFFQHSNSLRNNPRIMLQSIAKQLCNSVPGYQEVLETTLKALHQRSISDLNCEELFGVLFEEPLGQIEYIDHNVVIVIDALDECASQFKEEIEDVLRNKLCDLPSWIRFVITTRPLPSCDNFTPDVDIQIMESDTRNEQDIKTYLAFELEQQNANSDLAELVKISKGIFLVAHCLLDILNESGKGSQALDYFPHGISSVYKHYLLRIKTLIEPYIDSSQSENSFHKMLQAVAAAENPIPKEMFYAILHLKSPNDIPPEKIVERNHAVHLLHTVFPVENDHVTVFHKTVTDWLGQTNDKQHQFSVSKDSGTEVLAEISYDVLKVLKTTPLPDGLHKVLSDSAVFAIWSGIPYIVNSHSLSEAMKGEVTKDITISVFALKSVFLHGELVLHVNHPFKYLIDIWIMSYCLPFKREDITPNMDYVLFATGDFLLHSRCSNLSLKEKEELHYWLVERKIPHYTCQCVTSNLSPFFQGNEFNRQVVNAYEIRNGVVGVSKGNSIIFFNIKDGVNFPKLKTFDRTQVVKGISPDNKYVIITTLNSSKVELYDITTLEKKGEYMCPIYEEDSFNIFGEGEQWDIVVQARHDPVIYMIDGLNGQESCKIEINQSDRIVAVSQKGHILISNGNCNQLYTIDAKKAPLDKVYYHHPDDCLICNEEEVEHMCFGKFSVDGNYIGFCCRNLIHVFQTNNGSLYRKNAMVASDLNNLVFLSSSLLIALTPFYRFADDDQIQVLIVYDLLSNTIIYCFNIFTQDDRQCVISPQGTDNFIPVLYALRGQKLLKLELHCLEQI